MSAGTILFITITSFDIDHSLAIKMIPQMSIALSFCFHTFAPNQIARDVLTMLSILHQHGGAFDDEAYSNKY